MSDVLDLFREKGAWKDSLLNRAWASLFYQLKILASYRMMLALDTLDVILSALIYYFVSFLVSPQKLSSLGYTPNYVAFSISGIALSRYIWTSVSRLSSKMRHEVSEGTFETLAAVDVDAFRGWILGQILFGFTYSSLWFIGTILVGVFLGAGFTGNSLLWLQAVFIVLLTVAVHAGIGIMAAGMYIKYKQLQTLLVLLSTVIEFFGGVIYPLSLLYNYPVLYWVAMFLPFTHGLELFRRTIISGLPIWHPIMLMHLAFLLAFLPLIFLGFKVYEYYLRVAKREGLLAAY